VSQTTFERYRGIVDRYLIPDFGRVLLSQLTASHLVRCYRRLKERGLAAGTISLVHVVIHRALRDACRVGLLGRNVAELAQAPKPRDRDATERAFTAEQIAVLASRSAAITTSTCGVCCC
jgi:hypothetical protein